MRKTALNFEKKINKNAELRAKFEDEPQKFISSEADLDADIKTLSLLAEHPDLYPEFVKLGSANSLIGLLAHENTDIAIDVLEIVGELTDEDVPATEEQWDALVDAIIEADLLDLLTSNVSRLNEDDEADRDGVYRILGILENLCSRSAVAERIGLEDKLLKWLLSRIQRKEATGISQNKQYAAEILAILAQAGPENRRKLAIDLDTIDMLLQLVAQYRNRDPDRGSEEEEYMENLFEVLTCLVDEPEGKQKFVEAEGVELCLIMLKEGKRSKTPAIRLLDHGASGGSGPSGGVIVCKQLVEAGGLKTLFTLFNKTQDHRLVEHLLAIFANMLRRLPADSAERIRTLAKFVEKDFEKIGKLMKLRRDYSARVRQVELQGAQELQNASGEEERETVQVEILSRRLDAGLFNLQQTDVLLAWLAAEDGGAKKRIKKLLAERDESLDALKVIIQEQMEGLDTTEEENQDMKDMLSTLLEFL